MIETKTEVALPGLAPRLPFLQKDHRRKGLRTLDLLMIRHERATTQPTIENRSYTKPIES
jgi:hypothetical protein